MRRMVATATVAVLALALVGCSGSSSGSDAGTEDDGITTTSAYFGDGTDDAASTTASDDPTTTAAEEDGATGGDLVGTWTADAAELLAANTANLGGAGAVSCSGPVTLDLAQDGTFTHTGDAMTLNRSPSMHSTRAASVAPLDFDGELDAKHTSVPLGLSTRAHSSAMPPSHATKRSASVHARSHARFLTRK